MSDPQEGPNSNPGDLEDTAPEKMLGHAHLQLSAMSNGIHVSDKKILNIAGTVENKISDSEDIDIKGKKMHSCVECGCANRTIYLLESETPASSQSKESTESIMSCQEYSTVSPHDLYAESWSSGEETSKTVEEYNLPSCPSSLSSNCDSSYSDELTSTPDCKQDLSTIHDSVEDLGYMADISDTDAFEN